MVRRDALSALGRIAGPAVLAALLAASAATPGQAEPSASFTATFAPYSAIPDSDAVVPGAVDLAALEPAEQDLGEGMASWYGPNFAGRLTASGEPFDPDELTAAHPSLPFGSRVRVTNEGNGHSVVVRINDRGPYVDGRVIDLSEAAARALDMIGPGEAPVTLALLTG